jgi:hypothetical protein
VQTTLYRRRPIEVEAVQWNGTLLHAFEILDWMKSGSREADFQDGQLVIKTFEGDQHVPPGHFIIKGIRGEFHGCDASVFEGSHERIDP